LFDNIIIKCIFIILFEIVIGKIKTWISEIEKCHLDLNCYALDIIIVYLPTHIRIIKKCVKTFANITSEFNLE